MNPATDTEKADLAPGLMNRFTQLYCDKMSDQADITMLVTDYLGNLSLQAKQISSIVTFYAQVGTDCRKMMRKFDMRKSVDWIKSNSY